MLLYDVDDIDNAIKVAQYHDFRYFQYNSIISLGIIKNCYWRPWKRYKAHRTLKDLSKSKDPMTAYLAEIANNITLYDFYMNTYTIYKNKKFYMNFRGEGKASEIYPLIRDKQ